VLGDGPYKALGMYYVVPMHMCLVMGHRFLGIY